MQGKLLQHGGITLGDGEGWEPIGGVLRSILLPSIAVAVKGSRWVGGRLVLKLNTAVAFRCVRRFRGSKVSLISNEITVKTHAVFAGMREVVAVLVTVFVCQGDSCRSGVWRSMPSVEIGGAHAVCGFVRLE